ncbi:uncharacterized protein LOC117171125 [Belonocnema kinseyi]|uniref:uncharacterized protein LOC117171125 n=1 Tax=Belonocnema kinseyi TaxID=2817044 RepID=UPI00143CD027|nr:uncharacterized protein LOC117171125 [Belonocnema kinseyi]
MDKLRDDDEVLTMDLPEHTTLEGFANDIAAKIVVKTEEQVQNRVELASMIVQNWMTNHGLQLASQKTELVILTRKRNFCEKIQVEVYGSKVDAAKSLKYLGVKVDQKLKFWEQIKSASEKADKVMGALCRLMPNIAGPKSSKRKTLLSVIHSILLYGAEIWADALQHKSYRKKKAAVQRRGALRVTSAYCTTSEAAVPVIGSMPPPIDLLAIERKRVYERLEIEGNPEIMKREEKELTLSKWNRRWTSEKTGKWTR